MKASILAAAVQCIVGPATSIKAAYAAAAAALSLVEDDPPLAQALLHLDHLELQARSHLHN